MIKINDKITLGVIAGIFSNIIIAIIDFIFFKLNINKYFHLHIAASVYFNVSDVYSIHALIVGIISDFTIAAFLGIILVYILYYTGTDFFYVKGLMISLIYWLIIYGMILRLNIARIAPTDPGTNLVHLTMHIILGILTAWIITKHGIPVNKVNQ